MDIQRFYVSFDELFSAFMKENAFQSSRSGVYFRLNNTHEINLITIQKHTSRPEVCLNFGVHYDFLPSAGSLLPAKPGSMDLAECEIKVRVTPQQSESDHWWPLQNSSVEEIVSLICKKSPAFFEAYKVENLKECKLSDFDGLISGVFSPLTEIRACLILATINEICGDKSKAKKFADLGITKSGLAVGPRKALKDLIKRL